MPPEKKKGQASNEPSKKKPPKLYTLEVYLSEGPVSSTREGEIISRTIQIRGDQTLEDLHGIIFKAYDRYDPHLYEFLLGEGPDDRSEVYSLPQEPEIEIPGLRDESEGNVRTTTLDSLGLEVGRAFGYRFDFGDDWLHQIEVTAIEDPTGKGRFPKVVDKVGKSPPQYL